MANLGDLIALIQSGRRRESAQEAAMIINRLLEAQTGQAPPALEDFRRQQDFEFEEQATRNPILGAITSPFRALGQGIADKGFTTDFTAINDPDAARLAIEQLDLEENQRNRFLQQIEATRQRGQVEKMLGGISEITGIPQEQLSNDPEALQTLTGVASAFNKVVVEVPTSEGTVDSFILNTATGKREPIQEGGVVRGARGPIMPSITFNEKGGIESLDFFPADISAESVGARRRVDLAAQREGQFRETATDTSSTLEGIFQLSRDVGSANLVGTVGSLAQRADSFVSQVRQVLGTDVVDSALNTADAFIDSLPDSPIKRAAVQNAQYRATLRNTSIMLARAQDPRGRQLSDARIKNALTSLTSDDPGSREQFQAALRRTGESLVSNARVQGREFGIDADQVIRGQLSPGASQFFFGARDVLAPRGEVGTPGTGVIVIEGGRVIENTTGEDIK